MTVVVANRGDARALLVLVLLTHVPPTETTQPHEYSPVGTPTFHVTPSTADHEAIVRDAAHKFAAVGLDLPSLRVVFSTDDRACNGHLGLFESSQQPWRVTICSELPFVPVHELAHAWITSNIDEPTRQAYLQLRDKTSWDSPQLDWNDRGVEDAAFVIQQNLTTNLTGDLDDEWNRRAIAFEFLTGTRSPLRSCCMNARLLQRRCN